MSMTLDDLLNSLEKQASDQEGSKDKKKKDEEKEDEAEEKEDSASYKLRSAEKDLEDAKKIEDRVKEAHLQGSALANEIMQKVASAKTPSNLKETQMNKSAQFAGKALAQSLLTKLAGAGDASTSNGIYEGAMPNKAQIDNAQMVAEHDMTIDPTPTKDAAGDGGGSVNQIFDAIIAKAMAQGAASVDQVHGTGISQYEGVIADRTAPGNAVAGAEEEVEKVAAVNALMSTGFDIFSAVDMVKAAEQELMYEQDMQVKQAAMNELLNAGVDFELAAAMVKQAGAVPLLGASMKARAAGRVANAMDAAGKRAAPYMDRVRGYADDASEAWQGATRGTGKYAGPMNVNSKGMVTPDHMGGVKALARNPLVQAGTIIGASGLAGGGYALAREKQAAMSGLIDAGVDFDTAVALVAETSQELYGA